MGDQRRISLNSVPKSLDDKEAKTSPSASKSSSVRIEIKIPTKTKNAEGYEFYYPDLLKATVKSAKIAEGMGGEAGGSGGAPSGPSAGPGVLKPMRDPDDPLAAGEDEAEAQQLASYFERKYGGAALAKAGKRKGKKRKFDFKDYGMGYDENDPFVDNSEACDELLPNNMTTKMGGFYINVGQLELREVSEEEEEASSTSSSDGGSEGEDEEESSSSSEMEVEEESKSKKRRRPVIDDDDEDDDDNGTKSVNGGVNPRVGSATSAALLLAKKNKRLKMQKQISKRKKFLMAVGIEGGSLKGKKDSAGKIRKKLGVDEKLQPSSDTKTVEGAAEKASASPPQPSAEAGKTSAALMDNIIDSVIYESHAASKPPASTVAASSGDSRPASPAVGSGGGSAELGIAEGPLDASEELKSAVEKLKQLALASKEGGEGKKKFFTPQVNGLLLKIDNECKSRLTCGQRSRVFHNLAEVLPCNKETLLKRVKNLKSADDMPAMIARLKGGIDAVMPENVAKYKADCQKAAELKGKTATGAESGEKEETPLAEEGDKNEKKIYAPRRKFLWRRDMRENFYAILRAKLKEFAKANGGAGSGEKEGMVGSDVEDFLKKFLASEIRNLWPKGWMNERVLLKESRIVMQEFLQTLPPTKTTSSEPIVLSGSPPIATPDVKPIAAPDVKPIIAPAAAPVTAATPVTVQSSALGPPKMPSSPSVNKDIDPNKGIDLSVNKNDNKQSVGQKVSGVASATERIENDNGIDLTKKVLKSTTSEAEKAVQMTLEYALHQAQLQQLTATSTAASVLNSVKVEEKGLNTQTRAKEHHPIASLTPASHVEEVSLTMDYKVDVKPHLSEEVNYLESVPVSNSIKPQLTQQELAHQQLQKLLGNCASTLSAFSPKTTVNDYKPTITSNDSKLHNATDYHKITGSPQEKFFPLKTSMPPPSNLLAPTTQRFPHATVHLSPTPIAGNQRSSHSSVPKHSQLSPPLSKSMQISPPGTIPVGSARSLTPTAHTSPMSAQSSSPQKSPNSSIGRNHSSPQSPHRAISPQVTQSTFPSQASSNSLSAMTSTQAGLLSQQVAQALTPPMGSFNQNTFKQSPSSLNLKSHVIPLSSDSSSIKHGIKDAYPLNLLKVSTSAAYLPLSSQSTMTNSHSKNSSRSQNESSIVWNNTNPSQLTQVPRTSTAVVSSSSAQNSSLYQGFNGPINMMQLSGNSSNTVSKNTSGSLQNISTQARQNLQGASAKMSHHSINKSTSSIITSTQSSSIVMTSSHLLKDNQQHKLQSPTQLPLGKQSATGQQSSLQLKPQLSNQYQPSGHHSSHKTSVSGSHKSHQSMVPHGATVQTNSSQHFNQLPPTSTNHGITLNQQLKQITQQQYILAQQQQLQQQQLQLKQHQQLAQQQQLQQQQLQHLKQLGFPHKPFNTQ